MISSGFSRTSRFSARRTDSFFNGTGSSGNLKYTDLRDKTTGVLVGADGYGNNVTMV
jgi:hypothetical protein